MENSIFKQTIAQVGMACRELAFGCEQASEPERVLELEDVEMLAGAIHEINEVAKKLLEQMKASIDPALDHDGDTQPGGLEPPMLKCPCGYHGPLNDDYTCPQCGDDGERREP